MLGGRAIREIGQRRRLRSRAAGDGPIYAAVDLGTHNCRLLIAGPRDGGHLAVLDAFARQVRLGEGLASTGRLGDGGIERAVEALSLCARRIGRLPVSTTRAVATEACRRASNRRAFFARVHAASGLVLEPISADEEVRLTLAGCAGLLDPGYRHVLLFDIGGGSTEVVWAAQRPGETPAPLAFLSLPTGVVAFAERFGGDRIDDAGYARMVDAVDESLARFDAEHGIARAIAEGRVQMIGTSGTMTMLAALSLGVGRYRRSKVDGAEISFAEIARLSRVARRDRLADARRHPLNRPGAGRSRRRRLRHSDRDLPALAGRADHRRRPRLARRPDHGHARRRCPGPADGHRGRGGPAGMSPAA